MSQQFCLEFDSFDNPMQLSKIGNWVFTFLTSQDELPNVQLAITYVMPRKISDELQPRRVVIQNTAIETIWRIEQVECFNSQTNQELTFTAAEPQAQMVLNTIIEEFARYDVPLVFKPL
ncbi:MULTISPECIES: hypothetical protein [unclassified Acinetobacter]|uniref:hypothetical protein n=1 Tax=unclassified Acinetobacter TaxID=196816 RepID=UPI0015D2F74B|nr:MULTISPECIES: hypothetical protein [unclassified Acinetobacter]